MNREKKQKLKASGKVEEPKTAYLTTRTIERALSKATRNLTADAMELMGYVITVEDNWVVKKYKDGTIERIEEIEKITLDKDIELP